MNGRELAHLGLRLAALWIRVQAAALTPMAVLFLIYWSFRSFMESEWPVPWHVATIICGPIMLFLAAGVVRQIGNDFSARQDEGEDNAQLVAPLAAVLVVYGLWLACDSVKTFCDMLSQAATYGMDYAELSSNPGVRVTAAGSACRLVVGLVFLFTGESVARMLLRWSTPRRDEEPDPADAPTSS